jgi:hypothetical protein
MRESCAVDMAVMNYYVTEEMMNPDGDEIVTYREKVEVAEYEDEVVDEPVDSISDTSFDGDDMPVGVLELDWSAVDRDHWSLGYADGIRIDVDAGANHELIKKIVTVREDDEQRARLDAFINDEPLPIRGMRRAATVQFCLSGMRRDQYVIHDLPDGGNGSRSIIRNRTHTPLFPYQLTRDRIIRRARKAAEQYREDFAA